MGLDWKALFANAARGWNSAGKFYGWSTGVDQPQPSQNDPSVQAAAELEVELSFIVQRAKEQYKQGVRQENGTFVNCPATFKYGETGTPNRVDIYYQAGASHGHVVIKNGVVDYWRTPEGDELFNGRGTKRRR